MDSNVIYISSFTNMVLQARKIAVTCKPLLYQGRSIPMILEEEYIEGAEDATQVKLRQLGLSVGEQFEMDYDYGCTQVFKIRLDAVRDMENGRGTHYPYITDGRGRGIPDDVHAEEFGEIIKKIDADGVSDYHVERYGMDMIWDYRMFDLEAENCLLKVEIARIREAYEYEE